MAGTIRPQPLPDGYDINRVRLSAERCLCEAMASRGIRAPVSRRLHVDRMRQDWRVASLGLTASMAPKLHSLIKQAMEVLRVDARFEVYQTSAVDGNACVYWEDGQLVLIRIFGRWVAELDSGAMLALLGHELGHFLDLPPASRWSDADDAARSQVECVRKCFFVAKQMTADRFGLLACQDLDAVLRLAMVSVAGLPSEALVWNTAEYLEHARQHVAGIELGIGDGPNDDHHLRAHAVALYSESDAYRELTGLGPGSRPLEEIDQELDALLQVKRALNAIAPRSLLGIAEAEESPPVRMVKPGTPPGDYGAPVEDQGIQDWADLEVLARDAADRAAANARHVAAEVSKGVEEAIPILGRLAGIASQRLSPLMRRPLNSEGQRPDPPSRDLQLNDSEDEELERRFQELERKARERGEY